MPKEKPFRFTAGEARMQAAKCRDLAKAAPREDQQVMLESIAQTWDSLADSAIDGVDGGGAGAQVVRHEEE